MLSLMALLLAPALSSVPHEVQPSLGAKQKPLEFHGLRILGGLMGDVGCGRVGRKFGPYAEPAVILIAIDAVEQNGELEAVHGMSTTVLAGDRRIISADDVPMTVTPKATERSSTEERFFLAQGEAVILKSDVCPLGDQKGRNITSQMHMIVIAAPAQ